MSIGRSSTPKSYGATHTDTAEHANLREVMAQFCMTAIFVTTGAISLRSSSHFPLKPNSDNSNPVGLPPGLYLVRNQTAAFYIDDQR